MRRGYIDWAAAIVRAWVQLHTLGLPRVLRQQRVLEIESYLWEYRQDAHSVSLAIQLVTRMLAGAYDDVMWRAEMRLPHDMRALRYGVAGLSAAALLCVAALWTHPTESPLALLESAVTPMAVSYAPTVAATPPRTRAPLAPGPRLAHGLRPALAGLWIMDGEQSMSPTLAKWDPRRIAGVTDTLLILQTPTLLATQAVSDAGRVTGNAFDLSGLVDVDDTSGERVIRRASWSREKLVTVVTRSAKAGAWSTIDVYSLAPDGSLVVERVTESGERWSTYVQREPDRLRARVRDVFTRVPPERQPAPTMRAAAF